MKSILSFFLLTSSVFYIYADDGYKRNPGVDVTNYIFSISVSDTSDIIFGKTTISMKFNVEAASLEFDLKSLKPDGKGMNIDSLQFSGGSVKWSHFNDRIIVVPEQPVKGLTEGKLRIVYHGIPSDGLIISENKFRKRTFFSDNWPDRASNYIPCVDHPYDKATVDFIISAPDHYEIVASGYLVEISHSGNSTKLTHWREEIPLATKVMAFGAADFDIILAGKVDNVPVWTYVFKENREDGFNDYAVGVRPVEFFSELIGPFPYEKLANVQSKTIFGGLENAGCIFYSENSVTGQGKAEGLIAHEIAHQWFGNSVTENDWFHIWLSEGFATYLTAVYFEKTYGKERLAPEMSAERERVLRFYQRSPGSVIDTTTASLMRLLNPNSYQKGAWVLHMLRQELGEEVFWKGIRLYYETFRNRNAMTDDFRKVMEKASGKDLNLFFNQWLYVAGQPELKITRSGSGKDGTTTVVIEQVQQHVFRFPLDLLIKSREGSLRETLQISERITKTTVRTSGPVEVIPDPDVRLLFREVKE